MEKEWGKRKDLAKLVEARAEARGRGDSLHTYTISILTPHPPQEQRARDWREHMYQVSAD